MITPAISVLSAVEGLEIAAPHLHSMIVPITLAVLFGLFWMQRQGTATVGKLFGPVMLLWFGTLAGMGGGQYHAQPRRSCRRSTRFMACISSPETTGWPSSR